MADVAKVEVVNPESASKFQIIMELTYAVLDRKPDKDNTPRELLKTYMQCASVVNRVHSQFVDARRIEEFLNELGI